MKTTGAEKFPSKSSEPEKPVGTVSEERCKPLYRPEDLSGLDYQRDLGDPGEFPYTRGVHSTMYREKLWTMRQFSGFGSPEETNRRSKFLLEKGQTGLS